MPLTTLKVSNFIDDSVTIGKLSATGTAGSSTYLRGDNSWQALSGLSGLYNASTTTSYTVTVAASKFVIDGVSQATISLVEGYTAIFDVSDSSVSTHILRFATAADAAGSTEYTYGVTAIGTPGSAGAKVFFTVPIGAPGLFYYCTAHSSMGGTANTTTATTKTAGDMWITAGRLALAFSSASGIGVWSTQTAYLDSRYNPRSGGGSITAAITGGGAIGSAEQSACYSWDGLTWAGASSLNTARNSQAGAGTSSAGLTMGGDTDGSGTQMSSCEEYDGSSWATVNALNQGTVRASYGCGTQTAALNVGGWGNYPGPFGRSECAEYDGTSWTSGGATGYSARNMSVSGNSSAGLTTGGATGGSGGVTTTNTYNGSTWSSAPVSSTDAEGGCSSGIQSATIYNCGYTSTPSYGPEVVTQEFNGSAWSISNTPLKGTGWSAGIGTSSNMLNVGGQTGNPSAKIADVYEFDKQITVFPVA